MAAPKPSPNKSLLVAAGLLLGLRLHGQATPSLEELRRTFQKEDTASAYQNAKVLFDRHKNNIDFRELYFRILLKFGRLEEARTQLEWLLKVQANPDTLYLKAMWAFASKDLSLATQTCNEILNTDKRHVPTLLLLSRTARREGNLPKAKKWLRSIESFEPQQLNMLFQKGLLEIDEGKDGAATQTLARLAAHHPASHQHHYLAALLGFRGNTERKPNTYKNALSHLKQALFHKPFNNEYNSLKERLLFALGEHGQLLSHYANRKPQKLLDPYRIAFLHYDKAKKDSWLVPNLDHIKANILPSVRRALSKDPSLELVRRFGEKILLVNTPLDDDDRKSFADYHHDRASHFHQQGLGLETLLEYVALLNLSPQNPDHRKAYATFLEERQLYASSLKQLEIAKFLGFGGTDYRLDHRIALMRRRLEDSLPKVEAMESEPTKPLNPNKVSLMVVFPDAIDSLDEPLYNELYHDLLTSSLRSIYSVRLLSSRSQDLEDNILKHKPDLVLEYNWELEEDQAKLHVRVLQQSSRKVVHEREFVDSSKDKVFDVNAQAHQFLKEALPVQGVVLRAYANPNDSRGNLLISVGLLDGARQGDAFVVKQSKSSTQVAGSGTLIEVDETMSRLRLGNPRNMERIQQGFFVQKRQ